MQTLFEETAGQDDVSAITRGFFGEMFSVFWIEKMKCPV